MEKLVHLLWRTDGFEEGAHAAYLASTVVPELLGSSAGVRCAEILTTDTSAAIPRPAILLGGAADLASMVITWVDCIDDRHVLVDALCSLEGTLGRVDQYLVTESVPQRWVDRPGGGGIRTPGLTHLSWFPKPDRLTDEQFFHGWHEIHTPKTPELHPYRTEYVRDSVARVLTAGSPPVRAIVAERFATLEDYTDPSRLYGSDAALSESVEDLPLYADFETLNSRPTFHTVFADQ